ncbi:MAG: hypothetical protein ACFNO4_06180 [Dialister invisus]|uniref:hypothetical protein n=1 Tax=Dialister invisus TaxID=218538 RepID=UPI00362091B4
MKKKILSAALLSVLVSSALGTVTAGAVYEMDEVTVTADREGIVAALPGGLVNQTAKLGILGNKSIMDIPYSEMSMTEKTLETFSDPSQPLANVLQNNPSIRSSTSSPHVYGFFHARNQYERKPYDAERDPQPVLPVQRSAESHHRKNGYYFRTECRRQWSQHVE